MRVPRNGAPAHWEADPGQSEGRITEENASWDAVYSGKDLANIINFAHLESLVAEAFEAGRAAERKALSHRDARP